MPDPKSDPRTVAKSRPAPALGVPAGARRAALGRIGALTGVALSLAAAGTAGLSGCALVPFSDPPRVEVAGLDSLPGEGLEMRFLLRLRVQNPNSVELAYDGISLDLDLRGQRFASGVAPLQGVIPRYGEAVLGVPITVSGLSMARQLLGLVREGQRREGLGPVAYVLRGKLGGTGLGGVRFESTGSIELPTR